jgi:hypothetical protein
MTFDEATLTYLVALAVPLWLLVEQIVSRRGSRSERPAQSNAVVPPEAQDSKAPNLATHAKPVTPELRRKAA